MAGWPLVLFIVAASIGSGLAGYALTLWVVGSFDP